MITIPSSKRGSALLIVLGMLSFMIVSAVAFSVYMRMSRAPSSFLRRNVSSQHLVKAALARAIEDIDDKIGNDPYPGVGPNATDYLIRYNAHDRQQFEGYGNTWNNRIFCPYADKGNTAGKSPDTRLNPNITDDAGESHQYVDFDTTAAVLSLEALGYIPAPIVNQARYWSRRTETARWRRFNYDLGRWAYVAINVSDLLDINSIHAYTNRNSGDFGRLSLASAVKNANGTPQTFDNFVKNRGGTESQVPFTSIMDFNLALKSSGPVDSPFYDWITHGGNNGFYGSSVSNQVAPLLFVTDSWYPTTNSFRKGYNPDSDNSYYLSRPDDQPFTKLDFNKKSGFDNILLMMQMSDMFPYQLHAVGMGCLFDYLDKDSVPVSLSMPCTEAVPMIIGMCPILNDFKVTVEKGAETWDPPRATPTATKFKVTTEYNIKLDPSRVSVNAAEIFPFKRLEGARMPNGFKVQALVRMYLGPAGMPLRASNDSTKLRPDKNVWNAGPGVQFADNILTILSGETPITIPAATSLTDGDNESETIIDQPAVITLSGNSQQTLFFKHYREVELVTSAGSTLEKTVEGSEKIIEFPYAPYDRTGAMASWKATDGTWDRAVDDKMTMNVSMWMRVLYNDPERGSCTVDLAPATLRDDELNWNAGLLNNPPSALQDIYGPGVPLLNFRTDLALPWKLDDVKNETFFTAGTKEYPVQIDTSSHATLYCYDPRYNFAPEDWYSSTSPGVNPDTWLQNVRRDLLGQNGRDNDIFMFVSNQEYLQSLGELAFIPRVQDLNSKNTMALGGNFFDRGRYNGEASTFADDVRKDFKPGNAANNAFFWRTYRSYPQEGAVPVMDPIYEMVDGSGNTIYDDDGRGPRVNPYTEDGANIFMAAIGNTPYDYWAASTNKMLGAKYSNTFASNPSEALKHCFNNDSPLAKVTDKEMSGIASIIHSAMKGGGRDWLAAYNNLDWYGVNSDGDPQCFLQNSKNLTQTALNDVDRKFLYSYWRNCFGNRQQLFIVFVRAEPSVLGGAQQGGRAVALVWRDPAPPAGYENRIGRAYEKEVEHKDNDLLPPHRTRVLFYHQFE